MNLAEIVREVEQLSDEDKKELLRLLQESASRDTTQRTRRFSEFRGIGASLYDGEDAQDYVNRLRDEWERD